MDAEKIQRKYIPNGATNLKLIGGGNGKAQNLDEKDFIQWMDKNFYSGNI